LVVLRWQIRQDVALQVNNQQGQLSLMLADGDVLDGARMWEYTVLVSNAEHAIEALGQLYRDRCDCENSFDELKNQWGWGGLTTQDMHRSQIMARAVALVYNWWSWYVRAANPAGRREALTSRPLLLAAVGRASQSGGQTTLYLTPVHAEKGLIKTMIANVGAAIGHVRSIARQLPSIDRWRALLEYICGRILAQTALPIPAPRLAGWG
jgi:hypothetical protein